MSGWLAKAQLGLSILGSILMMTGLTAMLLGNMALLPAMLSGDMMTAVGA